MTMSSGEFWIADIPFTNGQASKKRPVLILWIDGQDAVVAAVTSAAPRTVTDVPLREWSQSGLRVASTVRLSRLDCLEQSLLLAKIGAVQTDDAIQLKAIWQNHVYPRF
jgi:mRNA interferase MazF